ncbi:THAP domain-containing protein 1-like [Odontomachus brunneus]|uniref:THAP domain-containing protein 1-like n=1 Tax=Odontomachus brunneus TaxID=486640 RepID=UPI0013F2802F|nr:THAP domain-containing protein 1-like [Odontomachus brunneus]
MSSCCCIPKCKNTTKDGFHLFRFPLNRPDILKMWIDAIGRVGFEPTKYHLICSAHFIDTDFMERPNASGVRLKNLAVPSIFCETSVPTVNSISADITTIEISSIEFDTTPVSASAVMPAIAWKSILKPREDNSTFSIPSPSTSTTDIMKMSMRKPRKIMYNSLLKLKKQEISPRKKLMWRTIKSLKQKLKRKEEKIHYLENLLKILRTKNLLERDPSEIIANNFDASISKLFQNEWINKNRNKKGC